MARRALLIANGSFTDGGITPLLAPVQDARRLGALLAREDVGGFAVEIAEDQDSVTLRKQIQRFFQAARPEDQTIVYFSGHGDKDADGQLYFNTLDTEPDLLEASAVPARYVIAQAKRSLSRQTVFLVDCCYSGAFAASLGVKSGTDTLTKDDFAVEGSHGMAVITASAGLQPAREDKTEDGAESLFTRHLINGIASGAADEAGTGKITLADLLLYVRGQLRAEGAAQEPRSFFFGLDGSEAIALNPAFAASAIAPELLAQCRDDDWRVRKLAIVELAELAEEEPACAAQVSTLLGELAGDPDDRVKRAATLMLARRKPAEATAPPPHPADEWPRERLLKLCDRPDVKGALERGAMIEAIKTIRAISNCDLPAAKQATEDWQAAHGKAPLMAAARPQSAAPTPATDPASLWIKITIFGSLLFFLVLLLWQLVPQDDTTAYDATVEEVAAEAYDPCIHDAIPPAYCAADAATPAADAMASPDAVVGAEAYPAESAADARFDAAAE